MTSTLWISFALVSAVNIITPGPANLNTMRRALQLGGRRVVPTILGNALGLAVGGALCAAGVASVVMASGALWSLFQWVGGGYLALLGIKLLVKPEPLVANENTDQSVGAGALFREAFLLATTNPKALLFYMALFPQVLNPAERLAPQAAILVLTYCGLSILSLSAYCALAHILRTRFITRIRYQRFRWGAGVILLAFAAKMLWAQS